MKFDFAFFKSRLKNHRRPQQDVTSFLEKCLLLDMEVRDGRIYHRGAVLGERTFERKGRFPVEKALQELDDFAADASAVLGHNILAHDLPLLREAAPGLRLFRKPLIDTLILSPLAFPENPYHRLVKDYKLVKDSINDPLADARLAASVFRDQGESFQKIRESGHGRLLTFYRFCLHAGGESGELSLSGVGSVFAALGAEAVSTREAAKIFTETVSENVCRTTMGETIQPLLHTPEERPALVRHQRRGLLTIVISPLQALMKDQVDNLADRVETPYAAALYGLLTPPERGEAHARLPGQASNQDHRRSQGAHGFAESLRKPGEALECHSAGDDQRRSASDHDHGRSGRASRDEGAAGEVRQ